MTDLNTRIHDTLGTIEAMNQSQFNLGTDVVKNISYAITEGLEKIAFSALTLGGNLKGVMDGAKAAAKGAGVVADDTTKAIVKAGEAAQQTAEDVFRSGLQMTRVSETLNQD